MSVIAHISDLHFGRHDAIKVEALLESLERSRPDLVAVSGDLTQRARKEEFAQARRFLDRIGRPIIVVPGNHDVPLYQVHKRLLTPFAKYNRDIAPAGLSDCFFMDERIAVLGLNTARRLTWKNGRVSHDQMSEIRRIFTHLPTHVWKVLVTHHPVASAHGEVRVELAGRSMLALRAIESAGVHVLLSGHHHLPASGEADAELVLHGSVLVVHAGTAVSTRTRGAEGNSYNLIELKTGGVTVSVMEWSDAGFQPARTTPYSFEGRESAMGPAV
jgi:3',5'-cyclic AMP phosphodiesterase CpdA